MTSPSLSQEQISAGSATPSKPAILPYPLPQTTLRRSLDQYLTVVRILMAEYRTTWFFQAFFSLFLPIGLIFFLKTAGSTLTPERAIFLLGGNLATSIGFGPTTLLLIKIGAWKQNREFDYWAALPMSKLVLVLGLLTVGLLFALPGLLGVYGFGTLMLGLSFAGGPLLLPIALLSALSLVSFGAILGTYVNNGQTAGMLGNLLMIVISFLSPTLMPPENLPAALRLFSLLIPTTYAANAFRAVLRGQLGQALVIDVLALALMSLFFLALLNRNVDWRSS